MTVRAFFTRCHRIWRVRHLLQELAAYWGTLAPVNKVAADIYFRRHMFLMLWLTKIPEFAEAFSLRTHGQRDSWAIVAQRMSTVRYLWAHPSLVEYLYDNTALPKLFAYLDKGDPVAFPPQVYGFNAYLDKYRRHGGYSVSLGGQSYWVLHDQWRAWWKTQPTLPYNDPAVVVWVKENSTMLTDDPTENSRRILDFCALNGRKTS